MGFAILSKTHIQRQFNAFFNCVVAGDTDGLISLLITTMNLPLLCTYLFSIFVLLATPGPVVALVTGTAARHGSRRAFNTVLGTHGASLVLIALAVLMLVGLVTISQLSLRIAALVGCLYIGYGAWRGLRTVPAQHVAPMQQGGIVQGFLVGFSNPKDILFFAALFPQFIAVTPHLSTSLLLLSLLWIAFDFCVMACYILAVRRWVNGVQQHQLAMVSQYLLLLMALVGAGYNLRELF
ncbi:LysE family translocator [Pantoea phytobeneficialis]|uniref:LysE family translocator n=2 Tax=Pantoea phytobeneficialis TaxID=2052056 RepID=A0ABT8XTP8_9GAMM|nr:LysE family translocator [Pantoea phytobeneficialis]MDO6406808.1 LysE family translocator [Pantoea phytobeneficialis]